jgi:hypothetical protein
MASSVLFIPVRITLPAPLSCVHRTFIPFQSSAPYRETLMEGMYSLSQLLGLVNHSFFNRDMRHNQYVYGPYYVTTCGAHRVGAI